LPYTTLSPYAIRDCKKNAWTTYIHIFAFKTVLSENKHQNIN
jgi:hypothetical protein